MPTATHRSRPLLLFLVVAGLAVPASYTVAFALADSVAEGLWGGVPGGLRPFYTVNMLLAAAGFFPFTWLLAWNRSPVEIERSTALPWMLVPLAYALVLVPSALWLPLTAAMIAGPSPGLWPLVRIVLSLVGLGSTTILWLTWKIARREGGAGAWLAFAGALPFFLQTAVLDALVWPAYYPR